MEEKIKKTESTPSLRLKQGKRRLGLYRCCLDFPDIQHGIKYDMPAEIENYVHRIGRVCRCGKTGITTTCINKNQSETTLLNLKHLLQEAKQRIPAVLAELNDPMEEGETIANASGVKGRVWPYLILEKTTLALVATEERYNLVFDSFHKFCDMFKL